MINWQNLTTIGSESYTCGYCGEAIASNLGYNGTDQGRAIHGIYICHKCGKPSYISADRTQQVPGAIIGKKVEHIPNPDIANLYKEAQTCFSISAYTASVMCCRKLLMNISVAHGAKTGKPFGYYVNYLKDNHYISPNGVVWVDSIRQLGNEANHDIEFKTKEEATMIITFTEALLKFIYEMPGIMKAQQPAGETDGTVDHE